MIEHSSKKYFALIVVSMLVTATLATSQPAYSAAGTGIMIPLYTYPGGTWNQVIETKNAHPSVPILAKINPSNGPGFSYDSNFDSGISELQAAGITVIGYVYTQWGARSTSAIIADIDRYKSWYPQLDGIFFDEMSNGPGAEAHYRNLNNYAKSVGFSYTVGNPGTDIASSYIGTMDNIIIYESGGLPSLDRLGGWHTSYDKSNFSYLAFGVGSLSTSFVDSSSNYVSWLYITNDNFPNPWDSVPPYFMDLAATLDDGTTTPPPPPDPTPTHTVTVQSVDLTSAAINGMWTEVSTGGTMINTGYTTMSFNADANTQYQVCVSDYQATIFDHWEDGSTNSCRTITPTQAVTLTAHYQTGAVPPPPVPTTATISVYSADPAGNAITGMWTEIHSGGTLLTTGFTPLAYTANTGTQYQVCVDGFQNNIFDHWEDGSTNSCRTLTPTQDVTLTASYKTDVDIVVNSVTLAGAAINGMWTEISNGGTSVNTGFTPLTYTTAANTQYQVCASDYQNNIFDHWEDGSTNSCRTLTPTQDTTLTASYKTDVDISVNSVNLAGAAITGMWTTISSGGTTVNTGFTPLTYTTAANTQYQVCVSNYQKNIFDHWEDGSTNSCRTITPTQAVTLTAYYKTPVAIKVRSLGLDGTPLNGLWTEFYSGNSLVKTGFTTLSYTGNAGAQYKVCMANYQNFVFDHWSNGSTNSCRTITPTQDTTLTAYYKR